ncbi:MULTISPECIES: helix-turn-helix domain-containing protein [unclassified Crossiella]|uniref:helix-turn-helix domain-containing protein n=1 Tax=unclassified Crossiella TaxID=2620835 RepID=UPI001FFEA81C|nr:MULTISPECIES: helix-turn-helix transcriptional regulator [unclassified Crossiella]MCK2245064.1 helix-turn-helix transcriptional regulator [Crossiella sp. S99.2]MCK2258645.1 helix-turn-helix transcriptional regulator [Crossiella sp. S99.1]
MDTVLGEFLRSRRARLTPAAAGLADYGDRRRVPGLRREELAHLAGVSAGYYTRLEQGQSQNASAAVLDALANALQLDQDERAHLHTLARPAPKARRRRRPERLQPHLRTLVATLNLPALILGRHTDILAWNPLAHALLAGHLDPAAPDTPATRPNWARLFFLDPHLRELFGDWAGKARDTVADLRRIAGHHQGDPALAELIGDLALSSPEFSALWSGHPVRDCASHHRDYRHPVLGRLTLTDDLLTLPDTEGQRLVLFHAEPGSASATALELLGGTVLTPGVAPAPAPRHRTG